MGFTGALESGARVLPCLQLPFLASVSPPAPGGRRSGQGWARVARTLLTLASLFHFTGPGFISSVRTKPCLGCRRKGSSFSLVSPSLAGMWGQCLRRLCPPPKSRATQGGFRRVFCVSEHPRGPAPRNRFPMEAVSRGRHPSSWFWGVFSFSLEQVTPKVKRFYMWTFSVGK